MSETEQKTLEDLAAYIKELSPEDKGYLLGYATAKAEAAADKKEEKK